MGRANAIRGMRIRYMSRAIGYGYEQLQSGFLGHHEYASNLYSIVFICMHSNYSYSPGGQALVNAYFGQGTGQIVVDNVRCTGSEYQLLSCSSATIFDVSSSCEHSDDAGVRCEGIHYVKCS